MKARTANLFWGFFLILAGGLFLLQNYGYLPAFSSEFWAVAFSGLSLLFFATYFLTGVKNVGWLFPASILGGVAITLWLVTLGFDGAFLGAPVLASIAVPFVVIYALDRANSRWALVPAWVMAVLTVVTLVVDSVPGEVIGALVLFSIALPFLYVYLSNRSNTWALIPALVLGAVGVIPLLSYFARGEFVGAFVLFVISVPFFVVYFWSEKNWWALIPAGVLASISLALLVTASGNLQQWETGVMNGIIFLGWAVTFFVLWLRRTTQPTAWAIYPAACLAAAGFLAFILSTTLNTFWPLALIAAGGLLVFLSFRARKMT
jgi:hypothetical protein